MVWWEMLLYLLEWSRIQCEGEELEMLCAFIHCESLEVWELEMQRVAEAMSYVSWVFIDTEEV